MTTLLEDILSVSSQIMDYLLNLSESQILLIALAVSIFFLPMMSLIILARYTSFKRIGLIILIEIVVIAVYAAATLTTAEFVIMAGIAMLIWTVIPMLVVVGKIL